VAVWLAAAVLQLVRSHGQPYNIVGNKDGVAYVHAVAYLHASSIRWKDMLMGVLTWCCSVLYCAVLSLLLPDVQSKVMASSSEDQPGAVQLWERLRSWLDQVQQVSTSCCPSRSLLTAWA
jgi:hypothetical protein